MQRLITVDRNLKPENKIENEVQFKSTCSGVPWKSLPHDKLNKVSPVKIAPDPGKWKFMWPAYSTNK